MGDSNFLEVPDDSDAPFENMFRQARAELDDLFKSMSKAPEGIKSKTIKPDPGFCVKLKDKDGKKIFINLCHTPHLPEPKGISDEELLKILESEDPTSYRVPLSLGLPHEELDKSGIPCTAYDVIINGAFFDKIQQNDLFRNFVITVAIDGIEDKYGVNPSEDDYVILKNKLYLGVMPEHAVQDRSSPLISEVEGTVTEATGGGKFNVHLTRHTLPGQPDTLVARISLPGVKSANEVLLDVGEDRIVLQAERHSFDIFVPCLLNQDDSQAEFNVRHHVLTVMMPIKSSA
uniref:PIH1 domain-containing protein 1 n=1 Tax=Ornithodoros turicata TaxID=34597 RepID=A0A2R5LCR6_9ACAR